MKVFLGGTVNGSSWRKYVIPKLSIAFFDPVVKEWCKAAFERERYERRHSDFCLYVITPKLTGFYALAEVIDDSIKRSDRVIYCYLTEDGGDKFNKTDCKILTKIGEQVAKNGGYNCKTLDSVVALLNNRQPKRTFESAHIINKKHDIYISYGRNDSKELAFNLSNTLKKHLYSVWYDNKEIPLEIAFLPQVNKLIRQCHCFVFIVSPHSLQSEYCLRELELVTSLGKHIILVSEHSITLERSVISDITPKLYIDLKQPPGIQPLIKHLSTHLEHLKPHTLWLNKMYYWQENQKDEDLLLYGRQRTNAKKWLLIEIESNLYSISNNVKAYISQSIELPFGKRCLFHLNKWLGPFISHKKFDAFIGATSIANPLALLPQLWVLFMASNSEAIAISMWFLFLTLQVFGALFAIKHRNFMLCISQLISMVITCSIIGLAFIKQ